MQMLVILPFTHCQLCSVIDIYIYRCYAVVLDHLPLWAKQMCIYTDLLLSIYYNRNTCLYQATVD